MASQRPPRRIVFMGTPAFAATILEALLGGPDHVVGVVCQPDRPKGRGLAVIPPPVKVVAVARGLPVLQPPKVRDATFHDALRALAPDVIVVAAYGRILPRAILDLPPDGCINVHASILPRHRGAAPIQHAILAGDAETGVTIMAMSEEMDAGDMLLVRRTRIGPDETAGTLTDRLATLGATALLEALDALASGTLPRTPQPNTGITFAPRIERDHTRLDWSRPAVDLERAVRAFAPEPAAFTTLDGVVMKVWRATPDTATGPAGRIMAASAGGIVVACGAGALRLLEIQLQGRKRLPVGAFLAGTKLPVGTVLGA